MTCRGWMNLAVITSQVNTPFSVLYHVAFKAFHLRIRLTMSWLIASGWVFPLIRVVYMEKNTSVGLLKLFRKTHTHKTRIYVVQ